MEGKIEKIWENEKNGKRYWVLEIGGEKYSVWDEKYVDGLSEGSVVDYNWRQSGNFRKITDLRKLDVQPLNSKNEQIVRMSCLRTAGEIISGERLDLRLKIERVLDTSKIFEKYVVTGDIPDEYKILLEAYDKKKT